MTGEDDIHDVYEEVTTLAGSWCRLALDLRVYPSLIRMISKYNSEPHDCLHMVVEFWLKRMYDVERDGKPSWCTLVRAVESWPGGAFAAVANAITLKYPGKCIYMCISNLIC